MYGWRSIFFLRCTILSLDKQYVTTTQTIKYRIFSSPKSICLPQTSHHLHPFPRGNHWSDSVPIILSSLEWEKWIIQSNRAFVPGTYHNAFELHVAHVFSCIAECVCVAKCGVRGQARSFLLCNPGWLWTSRHMGRNLPAGDSFAQTVRFGAPCSLLGRAHPSPQKTSNYVTTDFFIWLLLKSSTEERMFFMLNPHWLAQCSAQRHSFLSTCLWEVGYTSVVTATWDTEASDSSTSRYQWLHLNDRPGRWVTQKSTYPASMGT